MHLRRDDLGKSRAKNLLALTEFWGELLETRAGRAAEEAPCSSGESMNELR